MSPPHPAPLRDAAGRTVDWIASRIQADGSLGPDCTDAAGFYKLPYLLQLAGRPLEAHRLLDHIRATFLRPDGEIRTSDSAKTHDPVLALYPSYIDGWIAMASHKMGRFDLSYPLWRRLRGFWNSRLRGFSQEFPPDAAQGGLEVLTCAHLGLAALYLGDLDLAGGAGRALQRISDLQPSPATHFYLRLGGDGRLETDFSAEAASLCAIQAQQPGQAWFFIGYPLAFLSRLYRATGDAEASKAAQRYFDFAERCAPRMCSEHFAHKVAWGAAEFAAATGSEAARLLSAAIVRHLLEAQGRDGTWLTDAPLTSRIDQSAEVAIWLLEIAALG